jgi:hypothetical protein
MSRADAISAAIKSVIVTGRKRRGVSQAKARRPSQARVPFAAAMLPIAVTMHWMHMRTKIPAGAMRP